MLIDLHRATTDAIHPPGSGDDINPLDHYLAVGCEGDACLPTLKHDLLLRRQYDSLPIDEEIDRRRHRFAWAIPGSEQNTYHNRNAILVGVANQDIAPYGGRAENDGRASASRFDAFPTARDPRFAIRTECHEASQRRLSTGPSAAWKRGRSPL